MKRRYILFMILSVLLLMTGCARKGSSLPVSGMKAKTLSAPIINTEGKEIGEASFIETLEGLTIDIFAEGLPPGKHGTHIHEKGECVTPDFTSAGSHFNPTGKEHGFKNPKGFHLGDLPNIEVDDDGIVNVSLTLTDITLESGMKNSILDGDGSALIIHEKEDDYKTDPSGNSGDRIACAAITEGMVKK